LQHYQALEVKRYVGALEALQLQQTFARKIKVLMYAQEMLSFKNFLENLKVEFLY